MNNLPRQKLCELIEQYGNELCEQPRRCEGMLRDRCGEYKKEIDALMSALNEEVALDLSLITEGGEMNTTFLLKKLEQRLQSNLGLAPDAAIWAVESWALALGVIEGIAKDDLEPESESLFSTPSPTQLGTCVGIEYQPNNPSVGEVAKTSRVHSQNASPLTVPIPIYEFRRGFTHKPQGRMGDWVSTGFYGSQYVGITFPQGKIPPEIEQAIKAQAFEASQLVDIEKFHHDYDEDNLIGSQEFQERYVNGITIVGRTVGHWEVLAVITWAIDFFNRPLPVQRYFCCKRSRDYDAMATLICWWSENQLKFDICDNDPGNTYSAKAFKRDKISKIKEVEYRRTNYNQFCFILKERTLQNSDDWRDSLLRIWKTCYNLAKGNLQRRAWAINVASLSQAGLFTLIKPGSQEMLNLLSRDETSNVPTETIGLDNETSLKNILEKFMSQGQLSSQEISLVKQEIRTQNNPEKWHSLFDSINLEFHEEVSIIRFLVFQSLIIPEDVITLFQRLVWFDDETSWKIFKDTQQTLTSLSPEINQPSKEGAWLLINQIIENRYRVKMVKKLGYRLLNAGNLESKFFPEKGIWREALRLSLREMLENYEKNNSLSFSSDNMQIFLENIEQPQYKRKNKIGYYHLLAILENLNRNRDFTNFKFLQALISNKVKGKVSDALYREIKNQPHVNYPKFVNSLNKELTLNEKLKIVSKKLNKMYNYLTKTRYLPFIPKGVWYNTPVPRQKVMTILSKINDIVFSVNIVLFFVCLLFVALYNLKVNIHFTHFTLKEIYPYLIKCMWINGYIFTAQIIMLIFYFLIWLIRQPMNNR